MDRYLALLSILAAAAAAFAVPAFPACEFVTRPMTKSTDGVTRLNTWPEGTLLSFSGRKIVCSPGGVWQERGTGVCDDQEIAERDAATLEGTARPKVDAQPSSAEAPLGGPGSNNLPVGAGRITAVIIMEDRGVRYAQGCFIENRIYGATGAQMVEYWTAPLEALRLTAEVDAPRDSLDRASARWSGFRKRAGATSAPVSFQGSRLGDQ